MMSVLFVNAEERKLGHLLFVVRFLFCALLFADSRSDTLGKSVSSA